MKVSLLVAAFKLCVFTQVVNLGRAAELSYQPPELVSENGKLDVTLNVSLVGSLGGLPWATPQVRIGPGFNGMPIGPTLRVKPGDVLTVTLNNNLDPGTDLDRELYNYILDPQSDDVNVTIIANRLDKIGNIYAPTYGFWGLNYVNLHFHGMHFSSQAEDIIHSVDGGESKTYTFEVPQDKEPGLHWYHDHTHGKAAHSYMSSLFGFIIVEGTDQDITQAPGVKGATEVLMAISEGLVNLDGSVPPFFPIVGAFNWTSVTNGQMPTATEYKFQQGDRALFRVVSATVEPTITLSLPGHTMTILAYDGMPLPEPEVVDTVDVSGGGRVEFLVEFDTPGEFVLGRAAWSFLPPLKEACLEAFGFPNYPCISYDVQQDVALITVVPSDSAVDTKDGDNSSIQLPSFSSRLEALAAQTPVGTRTVALVQKTAFPLFQIPYEGEFVPPGVAFGINDRLYNPTKPAGTVTAGTCETWTVTSNVPEVEHPFHVHGAHFLVTALDGQDVEKPFWRDTMPLPSNVTLHVCYDLVEPGDRVLVHCHSASHLDIGMAAFLEVVAPPEGGEGGEGNESDDDGDDDEEGNSSAWSNWAPAKTMLVASFMGLYAF